MTCYLIDFENVHEDGFAGIGKVNPQDVVYCFFTRNAPKISLSVLAESKGIQFRFIEAAAGKQSLDMALGSYLGYLIARGDKDCRYVIISNDAGFTKVADFWNKRMAPNTVRVCRSIEAALGVEKKPAEKQRNDRRQSGRRADSREQPVRPAPVREQIVPQEQPAEPEADAEAPKGEMQPESAAENAVDTESAAAEQPAPTSAAPAEPVKLENDPAALEFVQNQKAKFAGEKNIRQLVYRAIVRKYGQKRGTAFYNSIKKSITASV